MMKTFLFGLMLIGSMRTSIAQQDIFDQVAHHYADNKGVKIHYVTLGEGPVLVMLHGFPDFWYTWRYQMQSLSDTYKVVAVDLRGYNLSDKPAGVEQYKMKTLMADILAVIDDLGVASVTLVANDWGGAIAWQVATYYSNSVDGLVACNIPHGNGIRNYLTKNPRTSDYAENFKKEGSEKSISVDSLVGLHGNLNAIEQARYTVAFEHSDFKAMLNYYKANYPSANRRKAQPLPTKKVKCPVLMIYGMRDKALPPGMLNNTWDWVDNELTLVTIPAAGHFVQQAAADKVTRTMIWWLDNN